MSRPPFQRIPAALRRAAHAAFVAAVAGVHSIARREDGARRHVVPRAEELSGLARSTYASAKRAVVLVIGLTLLLFGVALLVLPGPGIPVIFLALAVLATEFVWARHLLRRARVRGRRWLATWRRRVLARGA